MDRKGKKSGIRLPVAIVICLLICGFASGAWCGGLSGWMSPWDYSTARTRDQFDRSFFYTKDPARQTIQYSGSKATDPRQDLKNKLLNTGEPATVKSPTRVQYAPQVSSTRQRSANDQDPSAQYPYSSDWLNVLIVAYNAGWEPQWWTFGDDCVWRAHDYPYGTLFLVPPTAFPGGADYWFSSSDSERTAFQNWQLQAVADMKGGCVTLACLCAAGFCSGWTPPAPTPVVPPVTPSTNPSGARFVQTGEPTVGSWRVATAYATDIPSLEKPARTYTTSTSMCWYCDQARPGAGLTEWNVHKAATDVTKDPTVADVPDGSLSTYGTTRTAKLFVPAEGGYSSDGSSRKASWWKEEVPGEEVSTGILEDAQVLPGSTKEVGFESAAPSASSGPSDAQESGSAWPLGLLVGLVVGAGALAGTRKVLSWGQTQTVPLDSDPEGSEDPSPLAAYQPFLQVASQKYEREIQAAQQTREQDIRQAKQEYQRETERYEARIEKDMLRSQDAARRAQQDAYELSQKPQQLQQNKQKLRDDTEFLRQVQEKLEQAEEELQQEQEKFQPLWDEWDALFQEYLRWADSDPNLPALPEAVSLEKQLEQLRDEIEALWEADADERQELQEEVQSLRESESFLEEEIGQLEEAIEDYPEDVEALEEDIQACEDEMADLDADIEDQQANIEDAENAYEESQAEADEQYEEAVAETAAAAGTLGAALGAQIGSDVANASDNGGSDNPWNNPATAGNNPDSDNPDANKDLTWWQELCRAIQRGIDNTLDYGWPLGGMGLGSDVKFPSKDEMARRLGTTTDDFHDNIKKAIKNDAGDAMKRLGNPKNVDIGVDKQGDIWLRSNETGRTAPTGLNLRDYAK